MATIIKDNRTGLRFIRFVDSAGKRQSIHLGRNLQKDAPKIKRHVEDMLASNSAARPFDKATSAWIADIDDKLADRLAGVGLIPLRRRDTLQDLIDTYLATRSDIKFRTRNNLDQTRGLLIEFFGPGRFVRDIDAKAAEAWAAKLRKDEYSEATIGRHVKRARQYFAVAMRWELITRNSFATVKAPSQSNSARSFHISPEMALKLLEAAPDFRWRLVIALSRFGGLRIPSELAELTWRDIDWNNKRFWVTSPKTEHIEGREGRWVPLFDELLPYFQDALSAASNGTMRIEATKRVFDDIVPYRNLRKGLLQIIKRAGLTAWPRLWHNLRASRQTELTGALPIDFVCAIMGNTTAIAAKHYLQPRDDDFAKALEFKCVPFCVPQGDKPAIDASVQACAPNCQTATFPSEMTNIDMPAYSPPYLPTTPKGI